MLTVFTSTNLTLRFGIHVLVHRESQKLELSKAVAHLLSVSPFPRWFSFLKIIIIITSLLFRTITDISIVPGPLSGTRRCSGKTCQMETINPKSGNEWQLQGERF